MSDYLMQLKVPINQVILDMRFLEVDLETSLGQSEVDPGTSLDQSQDPVWTSLRTQSGPVSGF